MAITLKMVPTYSIGDKAEWRVQDTELIKIDGAEFVQLKKGKANHHGFSRLVYAKLDLSEPDKSWTLSTSVGYKELQDLRNQAQCAALESQRQEQLPAWQRGKAKAKAKDTRKSKHQLAELRDHRGVLKVALPSAIEGAEIVEIEVVTPVINSEDLRVKHDEDTIARVLAFIVERGFDDDLRRAPRDPELPKHVYKRGKKLVVLFPGEKKRRTAEDVDAARVLLDQGLLIDLEGGEGENEDEAVALIEPEHQAGEAIDGNDAGDA